MTFDGVHCGPKHVICSACYILSDERSGCYIECMDLCNKRREDAIERMADHILSHGLRAATLRPLAAAAGTSDRMLLYYFTDKDELLAATLHRIAERMLTQFDEAVPGEPRAFRILLAEVQAILSSDNIKPFMHLWLDLASGAARGIQPHLHVAGEIADGFLAWVTSRLKVEAHGNPATSAALFMACIEGMSLLEAVGRPSIADFASTELNARLPLLDE